MENQPKLIEVNYGLASVYAMEEGTVIEINHKLYGELRDKIIKHERRHKADRHYTKEDLKNDFQSENSYFFESLKFAFLNPECLINFFPLMFSYYFKKFTFNFPAILPFFYFGIIFSGFFAILFKINFFMALLGYSVMFILLNLLLMLATHLIVKKDKDFVYQQVQE